MMVRVIEPTISDDEVVRAVHLYGSNNAAAKVLGLAESSVRRRMRRIREYQEKQAEKEKAKFTTPDLPDPELPADVVWNHLERSFERYDKYRDASKRIPIQLPTSKVVVLHVFGDLHLGNEGTDHARIKRDSLLVRDTDGVWACTVGDNIDNWFGKLARLWAHKAITESQELRVFKAWLEWVHEKFLFMIPGNHDKWPTPNAGAISELLARTKIIHGVDDMHVDLTFDNGKVITISGRHYYRGSSQFNPAHAPMKAAQWDWDSHIVIQGHRHVAGHGEVFHPKTEEISICVQVGSYKKHDSFADDRGFRKHDISPSASFVIDPITRDKASRVMRFWSLDNAIVMMNALNARYEADAEERGAQARTSMEKVRRGQGRR